MQGAGNPTGLSHLLLPATLYIIFGTGSVRYTLAHLFRPKQTEVITSPRYLSSRERSIGESVSAPQSLW